jgi:cytochrome c peroxidase
VTEPARADDPDPGSQAAVSALLDTLDPAAVPAGVDAATWAAVVPADNQMTAARVALGRRLYFETALSKDGTLSCASCHDAARGFADGRAVSIGVGGKRGSRNAPSTMNAALLTSQFLDGRATTLEQQAAGPILNPAEMAMPNEAAVVAALKKQGYAPAFQQAYGRPISFADVARAIAAFERTLVFLRAPFDRFIAGDNEAMSPAARAGWRLFRGRGKCATCHTLTPQTPLGTDNRFHNIGVSARGGGWPALVSKALAGANAVTAATDASALGRFMVTRNPADLGAFRSSPLRNVALTAPYMHDGSMQTLWDTIDFYNNGGVAHGQLDKEMGPLDLGNDEVDQLVAFLFALTDERFASKTATELERQRTLAQSSRPIRDGFEPGATTPAPAAGATHPQAARSQR